MIRNGKAFRSLALQVSVFFLVGILLTGFLSYFILTDNADKNVVEEKKNLSSGIATDVDSSIREVKSHEWVIAYLSKHLQDETLDLEYDCSEKTEEKTRDLTSRNKGLSIYEATAEELDRLSEEEQKIYAEIVFNKWLSRLNNLKMAYHVSYLYFLATNDEYKECFFFVSASDGKMKRSSKAGDAYVFGTKVELNQDQSNAFRELKGGEDYLVYTEGFMDRYRYLFKVGDYNFITGMTFNISEIKQDVKQRTIQGVIGFIMLQILLSSFCLILIDIFVLRPLKRVNSSVNKYAESKDSEKIRNQLKKIHSKNEIEVLSKNISEMVLEIDDHLEEIKNITAEQERISAELNVATEIQNHMLPNIFPPFPNIAEFDIYASMRPAKEVGGDFYDFFMVDEKHVALVMADVSGKGVPAALFMTIAKILIKNRALLGESPSSILENVNNQICEGNEVGFFVTVWLAIIDIETGQGIAANAGHEHPVLCRKNGTFELVEYCHSLAVAAMEGMKFKEHTFELYPGDRIFVYTDGVPEATNTKNELYGTDRMLQVLNNHKDLELKQLLKMLKKDIDDFVGEATQFDDITMLMFIYLGKEEDSE